MKQTIETPSSADLERQKQNLLTDITDAMDHFVVAKAIAIDPQRHLVRVARQIELPVDETAKERNIVITQIFDAQQYQKGKPPLTIVVEHVTVSPDDNVTAQVFRWETKKRFLAKPKLEISARFSDPGNPIPLVTSQDVNTIGLALYSLTAELRKLRPFTRQETKLAEPMLARLVDAIKNNQQTAYTTAEENNRMLTRTHVISLPHRTITMTETLTLDAYKQDSNPARIQIEETVTNPLLPQQQGKHVIAWRGASDGSIEITEASHQIIGADTHAKQFHGYDAFDRVVNTMLNLLQ